MLLFEECLYGPDGRSSTATWRTTWCRCRARCRHRQAHIETPTLQSQLGAKGVGEAGTAGAPGAVMNAINDALAPLNARVTRMPFNPERILQALGKV